MRPRHAGVHAAAALVVSLAATASFGQSTDPAKVNAANAIYEQATKAMTAGDYATACPQLEEVVKLVPDGVGGRLTLAECYEKDGRLASAYASYGAAEAAAAVKNDARRRQKARERAAALEPRLAKLTLTVAPAVRALSGLEVRRDGVRVGPADPHGSRQAHDHGEGHGEAALAAIHRHRNGWGTADRGHRRSGGRALRARAGRAASARRAAPAAAQHAGATTPR